MNGRNGEPAAQPLGVPPHQRPQRQEDQHSSSQLRRGPKAPAQVAGADVGGGQYQAGEEPTDVGVVVDERHAHSQQQVEADEEHDGAHVQASIPSQHEPSPEEAEHRP